MRSSGWLILWNGFLFLLLIAGSELQAADVTIDARTVFQRMDGFGASQRVFDDPHVFNNFNATTGRALTTLTTAQQDAVLDALYVDLRITRVRPASPETEPGVGIEPQNDNADPNVIDPARFDFAWKNLDAHLDYLTRARPRGVNTYFLSPLNRETWMGTSNANDAAEYAEWLLAQALRCQTLGLPLPYLSVANEPSYFRNTLSGAFIRDVIKILGPKLRAANLNTLFMIPDDIRSSDAAAKAQTILADPVARSYVGALATHLYDEPITNVSKMKAVADQYALPLWMTEFSLALAGSAGLGNGPFDYAALIHELLATYNVSAIDYQWGFFGQWETKSQLLILNYNTTGAQSYTGFTLPKEYYVTGQYSKFVRPGARRIRADSVDSNIRVSAYVDGSQVAIVAFNRNTSGNPIVSFNLVGLPVMSTANAVRTSATENWASLPAINVTDSTFTATLPHQSITTFTVALPPPNTLFLNDSTRLRVGSGDDVMIGGFIVGGPGKKKMILRGIGPSLKINGAPVPDTVQDPMIELRKSDGTLLNANNDWRDAQQTEIQNSGLAPTDDRESAISISLDPGSYTVVLSGRGGTSGIGLVEAYDIEPGSPAKLLNISTRGQVQAGDNVMIGGVIIGGSDYARVIFRGLGPSVAINGVPVPGTLADPTLELHDGNGAQIAFDDNWKDSGRTEIETSGVAPTDDREAAIIGSFAPGQYTAILRGKNDTTGIGLVEAYKLN